MEESRREQWAFLGEVWLTLGVAAAALPIVFDLWGHTFTELAARMEHGLVLALLTPVSWGQDHGWLPSAAHAGSIPMAAVALVGVVALLTLLAALIDPPPGTKPNWPRRLAAIPWVLVVGVPLIGFALAAVLLGAALNPLLFAVATAAGIGGGLLGRKNARSSVRFERSLTGLPTAVWRSDHLFRFSLLLGAAFAILASASMIAVPFDGAPLAIAQLLDKELTFPGPRVLSWVFGLTLILLTLVTPTTRRTLDMMTWEPWAAGGAGAAMCFVALLPQGAADAREALPIGFALGGLGTLLAAAGVPWLPRLALHPVRATARLLLPIVAAGAVGAHVAATAFLGCEEVLEDPRLELLSDQSVASDLHFIPGNRPGLFATFRRAGTVTRFDLKGGEPVLVEGQHLTLRGLTGTKARFLPTVIGQGSNNRIFVVADILSTKGVLSTAALEMDAQDGMLLAETEDLIRCGVSSWAWSPFQNLGLVGCEVRGGLMLYEPSLSRFLSHEQLVGSDEVSSVTVDPQDGSLVILAQEDSPFITRFSLENRRPINWRFLGASNSLLTQGVGGMLHVPRFLARQVLTLHLSDFQLTGSKPAGFALGSAAYSQRWDRLFTGSLIDGQLYATDTAGTEGTRSIRLGGWIKSLALDEAEHILYAGGMCGVVEVHLRSWLGSN